MILAGDIGGTSTRLALFEMRGRGLSVVLEKTYPSREHAGLAPMVEKFVSLTSHVVEHASFGISGPVQGRRAKPSNLPWTVDALEIASMLGISNTSLLNDLEANAYGVAALGGEDFVVLNEGASHATGNAAVISAGTGLGEAGLFWNGRQHLPFAAEGGHADFAPRNELEIDLLRYLLKSHKHVSYERVLSGPGLRSLYHFLRDTDRGSESVHVTQAMHHKDASAAIAQAGLDGSCKLCADALDLFVSLYGAAAGNLALKIMATGGVYIGGGIAPKILPKLRSAIFMEAFLDKGRMRALCEAIPVRVILNPQTALLGSARYAALQASLIH